MAYQKLRHDFGCTNVGSNGAGTDLIGMMLAETRDGRIAYEEYDAQTFADQFFTGAANPVNINPEQEVLLTQADWRAGMGLEIFDVNDPTRYFRSTMDMSNRGMGICGQKFTSVTKPSTTVTSIPVIANPTFEDDSDWTGGSRLSDQKYQGTYSWGTGSTTAAVTILQNTTTWTNDWQGKEFTFRCWVRQSHQDVAAQVEIYDGQGTTKSSAMSAVDTWTLLTVTRTLHASASLLRVQITKEDTGGSSYSMWADLCSIDAPASSGIIVAHAEFNDELYMASGNVLSKLNGGGTAFTEVDILPGTISDIKPFQVSGVSYLFIALGTSNTYWYMTTAEAITQSTAAISQFKYFVWVFTTADTFYGSDSGNTIRSTTNPLNGGVAWSSTITVGLAEHAITKLIGTFAGALYVMKEDKPYYLDSSGNVQQDLAPELTSDTSSTSGKNAHVYLGRIYIPAGDQTLLETDGTPANNVNRDPASYATNLSDYVGRVQALASDGRWLFAIVDNSGSVEILKGRNEVIGGSASWVWHPIGSLTLTNCETVWVSTVVSKRLWIASDTASESLYYMPLPTKYGDVTNDANRDFLTGTLFETPLLHGNFKADNKAWIRLTLTMGHTYNAGRYFTLKYKKLGDTSWINIGNFTGSSSSMVQSRAIDATNKPFTTMLQFQFTSVTNSTNETPILYSYEAKSIMYPKIRKLIHCVVSCREDMVCKNGITERNSYDIVKTTLDNARDNAVWPISIRDIDGSTLNVKFLPVPKSLQRMLITKKEKRREQEREYHLLLMEVDTS